MIKVRINPQRVIFLEDVDQVIGNPHREYHRHPRTDTNDLYRRHFADSRQYHIDGFIAHGQRVTAGDDHVGDFRVSRQIGGYLFQATGRDAGLACAGNAFARAVAAVHRTSGRGNQQRTIRIAMHQPGNGHIIVFFQRIAGQERRIVQLVELRHTHLKDRIGQIDLANQRRIVRRDRHGVLADDRLNRLAVGLVRKIAEQLLHRPNSMAHLPSPVIPAAVGLN